MISDCLVWLSRIRHRKGFGVQSPFAYNLVCGVINERGSYYAYAELQEKRAQLSEEECCNSVKVDRLLFRLSNFVQPSLMVIPSLGFSASRLCLSAGCRAADVVEWAELSQLRMMDLGQQPVLLYVRSEENVAEILSDILPVLDSRSLVVIEGIHKDRSARKQWKFLTENPHAVLTFDLYKLGLVFLDKKYVKQHYIVNF